MADSKYAEPSALDGRRLLLILLRKPEYEASLVSGVGHWTGAELQLVRQGQPPLPIPSLDVERNSFNPHVLPRLIDAACYGSLVAKLSAGVYWCVPSIVQDVPDDAVPTPGLLNGLALGRGSRSRPPNKRLKLTAPGLRKNCVCAPTRSVLVSIFVAPAGSAPQLKRDPLGGSLNRVTPPVAYRRDLVRDPAQTGPPGCGRAPATRP
jgi:hypothetical protein